MNEEVVYETIQGITLGQIIPWVCFVIGIIGVVITATVFFYKFIEKYRKSRNYVDDRKEEFDDLKEKFNTLETNVNTITTMISDMINSQKWSMADRLNEKIKHYYTLGYIPVDEFDEFGNEYQAYRRIGGNSSIEDKYEKAIHELPMK